MEQWNNRRNFTFAFVMKILVTGSSGTIGTRLCERLLETGHEVVGADWEPCKWIDAVEELRIEADLRKAEDLSKLPGDVDMVVHLAANARVYELVEHPDRACDNFISTFNVLEYARKNDVKKVIFASSRETYGNIDATEFTEDMVELTECESPYTASKIGGEAILYSYQRCYDIDHITFRFSNVYGMYDDSIRVVPLFIRQARANEPMTVYGTEKSLDFTYIDDCIHGILLGIEKFDHVKNDTYNLAFGSASTLVQLAQSIRELTGSSSEINIGEPRTGEVIKYVANIDKARSALEYNPQTSFADGVKKAVEWYSKNT